MKISKEKNLLAKKLTSAKAKAIAKQNALTAAQVKAQAAKVKVTQATAILETHKKDLINNDKVAGAQDDALTAIDKAKESVAGSQSKIDQISVAPKENGLVRSLPLILTIVAVVAVVTFFATLAIRRSRRRKDLNAIPSLPEIDISMDDFIKKMNLDISLNKKTATKKSVAKKSVTKKSSAKNSSTKKSLAKKSVAKKTAVKKSAAKRRYK